jgi:hypothetical protein
VLGIVDRLRPLHLSIVGGEPLVRYRELQTLLPILASRGIHVQLGDERGARNPAEWHDLEPLVDCRVDRWTAAGARRAARAGNLRSDLEAHRPGTASRSIAPVTRQQVNRDGYVDEFLQFWSARPEVEKSG